MRYFANSTDEQTTKFTVLNPQTGEDFNIDPVTAVEYSGCSQVFTLILIFNTHLSMSSPKTQQYTTIIRSIKTKQI